jgi:nucleotide-binding universal stress UspA family protein
LLGCGKVDYLMKILLAVDGSVSSDNAIDEVLNQPWPEKSECLVITVAEPLHNVADATFGAFGAMALEAQKALDADIRKLLAETTQRLEAKFGKGKVSGNFYEGRAIETILQQAGDCQADLVVLGSHGTSGYNDQLFGSVTIAIAVHAPCSVRIVHDISSYSLEKKQRASVYEEARYLVAINGSANSREVVESICSRPWLPESIFQVLSVVPEPKSVIHSRFFKDLQIDKAHQELYAAQKKDLEKLVKDSAAKIESKLVKNKVTYHVLEGNVRSLILQTAQDWPADMIIIGAHDHDKSVMEHFLGSVAQAVVNNADCSVEIVRSKK